MNDVISDSLKQTTFIGLSFDQPAVQKDFRNQTLLIIGKDYEDLVGIRKKDGSVFSISSDGFVFMNSSVQKLEEFINICTRSIDFNEDYDGELREKQVKKVWNDDTLVCKTDGGKHAYKLNVQPFILQTIKKLMD